MWLEQPANGYLFLGIYSPELLKNGRCKPNSVKEVKRRDLLPNVNYEISDRPEAGRIFLKMEKIKGQNADLQVICGLVILGASSTRNIRVRICRRKEYISDFFLAG